MNKTDGGDGVSGAIRSPETKKKISDARMGEKHPRYNKKWPKESISKMSQSKMKDKNPMFNRPVSKETRDKRREKMIGVTQPLVVCPYCNKTGGASNMKRYHFDKCKLYNHISQ